MKKVIALIATLFAVTAFAADAQPAKQPDTSKVEAKTHKKADAPAKSTPVKDEKAAATPVKPAATK
jgi:hypothetical protein